MQAAMAECSDSVRIIIPVIRSLVFHLGELLINRGLRGNGVSGHKLDPGQAHGFGYGIIAGHELFHRPSPISITCPGQVETQIPQPLQYSPLRLYPSFPAFRMERSGQVRKQRSHWVQVPHLKQREISSFIRAGGTPPVPPQRSSGLLPLKAPQDYYVGSRRENKGC